MKRMYFVWLKATNLHSASFYLVNTTTWRFWAAIYDDIGFDTVTHAPNTSFTYLKIIIALSTPLKVSLRCPHHSRCAY